MNYAKYITSPHWKTLRQQALERDGFRCRGCDASENLQVHHRRYGAKLGTESVDDLTTLCGGPLGCHHAIETLKAQRKVLRLPSGAHLPKSRIGKGTYEQATALFAYEPDTGRLLWRVARSPRVKVGDEAGCGATKNGHRTVWFNGRSEMVARVAWLIQTGSWPTLEVIHLDGDSSNNKWLNLEEVTRADLARHINRKGSSKAGHKGVYKVNSKWSASYTNKGRRHYLGVYDTPEEASRVRQEAIERLMAAA